MVGQDAVWKLRGEAKTRREIYFALYQAIGEAGGVGIFRDYAPHYFDRIVVDDCHRGPRVSARAGRRRSATKRQLEAR